MVAMLLFVLLGQQKALAQNTGVIVHDPCVAEQNGTFYLFCTGWGISEYSSTDLKSWKSEVSVFKEPPAWTTSVVPDFKGHFWAPDISFHNGCYYLYYAVSAFAKNTSAIGLATNPTLNPNDSNYHWTDQGIVVQSIPNRDMWNAIDPNLFVQEDGTPWMVFGSFWGGIKMVKLTKDLKTIAEPEEWYTLARRQRSFDTPDDKPGDAAIEAPFLFKKGDYYYLFVSLDLCCRGAKSTYKFAVGRSKNITGPYLDEEGQPMDQGGATVLVKGSDNWYGAGHNSIYTFKDKDYVFYHAYDASDNSKPKLQVSEVGWQDGWPVIKDPLK